MKYGASVGAVFRPQSSMVRNDDGAANRESQPQTAFLGGDERVEDALQLLRINASAAIEHRSTNGTLAGVERCDNLYSAVGHRVLAHRFAGIEQEIQQH